MAKRRAAKRTKSRPQDDQAWIRRHFEELVDKYPGKYAVVAAGELFVGDDARQLHEAARRKHPDVVPTSFPIPSPEDFTCAL